ncbi:MAG TPA: hypothetical protein VGS79_26295, partial [Puia sp.]|nr:hypothetical protein [Puia sp.]
NPPVEVPTDASSTCSPLSASTLAAMFQSGTIIKDGIVNAPNSLGFTGDQDDPPQACPFYQWAEQGFLWVTSPAPAIYGGNRRVFESPIFYDVTPPDINGNRTLIPHSAGLIHMMAVRAAQAGPHHLPIVFNKAGILLEVEEPPTAASGKQLILDRSGQPVEIREIRLASFGRPVFLGANGKPIAGAHPLFRTPHAPTTIIERFIVGGKPIFLNTFGDIVQIETGQADGGVLMTQDSSLIYYLVMVNDVYAYFRTGVSDGKITASGFPADGTDMQAIETFAAAHSETFPDSNAMAVELKSSWVLASSLPDPADYFTITATVPRYNKTDTLWTPVPGAMDTVQLAMIGMHVVGTVVNHQEMVWSTFVHTGVAPDTTYSYFATGSSGVVPANTNGTWLLCANGTPPPYNQKRMTFDAATGNIKATAGNTIGPTNVISMKPWGAAADFGPSSNFLDNSPESSNSDVIAINDAILSGLITGDLRRNYIFKGATWTLGGDVPTQPPTVGAESLTGDEIGTSSLSNVTMETFQQGINTSIFTGTNCFNCHQNSNPQAARPDTGVSHIFYALKPLF